MQALGKVHLQPEFANEKLLIQNVSYFVDLAKNTIVRNTQRKPKTSIYRRDLQNNFQSLQIEENANSHHMHIQQFQ